MLLWWKKHITVYPVFFLKFVLHPFYSPKKKTLNHYPLFSQIRPPRFSRCKPSRSTLLCVTINKTSLLFSFIAKYTHNIEHIEKKFKFHSRVQTFFVVVLKLSFHCIKRNDINSLLSSAFWSHWRIFFNVPRPQNNLGIARVSKVEVRRRLQLM